MKIASKEVVRQKIIDEIVATLEFLQYLKSEAIAPVKHIIKREESKKRILVRKLESIYGI